MTALFQCVLSHPDVYKKLQKEVDARYPAGENVLDTKHHVDMPYLSAVMYVLPLYKLTIDGVLTSFTAMRR